MSYSDALKHIGLETLCKRRQNSCKSFMNKLKLDRSSINPLSSAIARQTNVRLIIMTFDMILIRCREQTQKDLKIL